MKKYIIYLLAAVTSGIMFAGCELFGLDFQEPYDFDAEKGLYDNQLKMTAWEFMKSRQDIFSDLLDAISYSGVDTALFNQSNSTLLLVTNQGLTSTTSSNQSYWYQNRIEDPENPENTVMPFSWDVYPKEQIKQFILYHIIKGAYSYNELSAATQGAISFFPTHSTLSNGYVALQMKKEGALSIYFNNFPSHYKVDMKARTNNLQVPNGTYIHVLNNWLDYPTEIDLALYPIYNK
jgi:uncharacterized surface protein with fasciclin (FAS1) repeats